MQKDIDRLLAATPLLMAKELAKKLDVARKDVNSLLHGNPDKYQQDSRFRWRLLDKERVTLVLPGKWVTGAAFEKILADVGEVLDRNHTKVEFKFSKDCSVMIDCIAKLLALMNQLVQLGKTVIVDFTDSEKTKTYLDRAGFFDLLDSRIDVIPERPTVSAAKRRQSQSDTLEEFGLVDPQSDNEELVDRLTNKFVQQASEDYRVVACTIFGELIGNVKEHSQASHAGFAGLQKYGGARGFAQGRGADSSARPVIDGRGFVLL